MPDTRQILDTILRNKLIAVVRLSDPSHARAIIDAIAAGGITAIEITLTTPGALELIGELAVRDDLLIGAGTVMTPRDAERAFAAGAAFFASPVANREVMALAREAGRIAMPGAYTPTEIVAAADAGADLVKIFPMPGDPVAYIRALRGPLPTIRLAPSGGVNPVTAPLLIAAGASALNVGTWLTHGSDGQAFSPAEIRDRALQLTTETMKYER